MDNDQIIEANHLAFMQLVHAVEANVDGKQWDAALLCAETAANWAWLHGCGIFASPRLEAAMARIGEALPDVPPNRRDEGSRRVLTVVSGAFGLGGHTRLAVRWMALDRASRHTLVLTRQGGAEIPGMVAELVERGSIDLVVLDEPTPLARAAHLRELLAANDYAVLHIHPDDPVPVVALAGMASPPPVLFEDHASHVFWIGASMANVLVSLIEPAMQLAVERRGLGPAHARWVPIPLDLAALDRRSDGDMRARFDIPPDATLLMSSGASYKFMPIDGVSLATLLEPVLEARPEVHLLLVGPEADPPGTSLQARFPGRVHMVGYLGPDDLMACHAACDIYLDASPFPSNTALLEAASTGRPVLKFAPLAWRQCGFSVDLDAIPAPAYIWSDASGYRQDLLHLIDEPAKRAERGRFMQTAVRLCQGDDTFLSRVESAYAAADVLPRMTLDADACAPRQLLVDRLSTQLAANLEATRHAAARGQETYATWLSRQALGEGQRQAARTRLAGHAGIEVMVIAGGDRDAIETTVQSVQRQTLPATMVQLADADWVDASHAALERTGADVVVILHAGDVLRRDALLLLAERFVADPDLACCYVDEDSLTDEGSTDPIFKPDINLDLLRSYPYTGRTLALRRQALLGIGGLRPERPALALYDAVFRIIEQNGLAAVGHLPEVLLHAALPYAQWLRSVAGEAQASAVVSEHLDRLGVRHEMLPGPLDGVCRVRYLHDRQPPVSIIIPTRDQLPLLNALVDSLLAKTRYPNYELLIVDNDSRDPAACAYLDGIEKLGSTQLRVLRYPHPFNYSAINNFAASQARGEYLILLNNDTAVLHEDWIDALLNHAQRPEVGIVGAKLHYPDGRIQHAGVVLGLRGPADHPFIGEPMEANGYMHRLQVDQNYTAVTAACLMIRKSVYEEVGGLDEERFKVSYNDVDLCLKVREAGYLTVWTPYARLMHEGNVSQKKVDTSAAEAKRRRFAGEQEAMYRKWLPLLARDPAYNRHLGLDGGGFDLDLRRQGTWQPFSQPLLPRMYCIAADSQGCGHYRVRQPFAAMLDAGLAEGDLAGSHATPVGMERFEPSAIVLQRQLSDAQLDAMRGYREFNRAFKVYELDDYLPNVPVKSAFWGSMPRDVTRVLRKALALTDRFVVSTEALAEQFAGFHSDIRVVPNRLPVSWWGDVAGRRRGGSKPRVGWAGGASHRGDLELIADVVRDLADEVEWVFFGMCPDRLRPYVHEFHPGVPIDQYPRKLASMDLDLALAPVEDNVFNACKSNLRVLEYGACGFPVICSDIACYRGDLPVTRVKNRYKDWIGAIRMHLDDADARARQGDALREAIHRDWMLSGIHLEHWRDAWTGH